MNAVCEAKDERQVAWAWCTDLIHPFSLGRPVGPGRRADNQGDRQGQWGCLHCDGERQELWGPPRRDASSLLSTPAGMNKTPPLESLSPTSLIPGCR